MAVLHEGLVNTTNHETFMHSMIISNQGMKESYIEKLKQMKDKHQLIPTLEERDTKDALNVISS